MMADKDSTSDPNELQLFPILLISRRASIRLSMENFLKSQGYAVLTAEEGETALEIDRDHLSQLIIIDTPLSDMALDQFLKQILSSRNLMKDVMQVTNVPIILVSSPAEKDMDERKCKKYGILAVLQKPINLSDLSDCVHDVMTGKLSLEAGSETPVALLDPERRALEYFSKLLVAEDISIHQCKDEIDLNALERVGVLVVEVMGIKEDPVEYMKKFLGRHQHAKIVVVTAFHDTDMERDLLEAGVFKFLTKPIDPMPFRHAVREAITAYQQEAASDDQES